MLMWVNHKLELQLQGFSLCILRLLYGNYTKLPDRRREAFVELLVASGGEVAFVRGEGELVADRAGEVVDFIFSVVEWCFKELFAGAV